MYSNMCVKIALCLALIASIDGHVLKHRSLPLSAEGMNVDITVRSKEDPRHPLSTTRVDINEKEKTVVIATAGASSGVPKQFHGNVQPVPTLGDRNGINVGLCPKEYVSKSKLCFPLLIATAEVPSGVMEPLSKVHNDVPTGDHLGVVGGMCAEGYTPRGLLCVPDDYSDYVTE